MYVRDQQSGLYLPDKRLVRHQQKSPLWQGSSQQVMLAQRIAAAAGIALVASIAKQNDRYGGTTDPIDTTSANFLAVVVGSYSVPDPNPMPLSDSYANDWDLLSVYVDSDVLVRIYYAENPTVGTGHTFTYGGGFPFASFASICVAAFSGMAVASVFDDENGNNTGSYPPLTTGSVTPAQASTLFIAGLGSGGDFLADTTIDSGFAITDINTGVDGEAYGSVMAWKAVSSIAAEDPEFSTSAPDGNAAATLAAFKGA